jgi:hypothetical protein
MCAMPAKTIAMTLGGRKAGGGWMACCPAHDDRKPSLSICDTDDAKVLVRCHAGCTQEQVIAALKSRGLWPDIGPRPVPQSTLRFAGECRPERDDTERTEAALAVWQSAIPASGTLLERYLESRSLHLIPPSSLRFHAALKQPGRQMVPLNASAFVILTGNGLTISEDLARRFVAVDFDPRTEDPEARPFTNDIRMEVTARRKELLAALLTIWRWGRIATDMQSGLPLGSFEQWCRWVRNPLLALGCHDPAERVSEAKERDGRRQAIVDLFATWWERHGDAPVPLRFLHDDVKHAADAQGRGRQYLSSVLEKLAGTRMAGFVLTRQTPAGRWGGDLRTEKDRRRGP